MNIILVPIDFSPVSRNVVREAARLSRAVGGRIVLMHVVQPPVVTDFETVAYDRGIYVNLAEKNARQHLARTGATLRKDGVSAEFVEETGHPATCILAQAKRRAARYIVLGSHGHTAFFDLIVGSTASGVLKRASCPVVVVPSPAKAPRRSKR